MVNPFLKILQSRLYDGTGVYVQGGVEAEAYFARIAERILNHICEPYPVSAEVVDPGFPHLVNGERIEAICVAESVGRRLVYRSDDDLFYAFWGTNVDDLEAPGIYGGPLYCWSA